jgi:hypothetical protein
MALIPATILFLGVNLVALNDSQVAIQTLKRYGAPILLTTAGMAVVYLYPLDHPHNFLCHSSFLELLVYLVSNVSSVIGQYLSFLGFPVCWLSSITHEGQPAAMNAQLLAVSRVFGAVYVLATVASIVRSLRKTATLAFHDYYLSYTAILAFTIVLARTPVLGDITVINYAYSAYMVPGWSVLIFLLIRSFDTPHSPTISVACRDVLVLLMLVGVTLMFSYQRGRTALLGTLDGQEYLNSLYVKEIVEPSTTEARDNAAAVLSPSNPTNVIEGTDMLKRNRFLPSNWFE